MGFATAERSDFCDAALAVGPDRPTLCEGWTVADLVAHAWTRENDPVAAAGAVVPVLAGVTDARRRRALERWGFTGLVELVRHGPPRVSPFALFDERANTAEFFIHTEDIRRPNGLPRRPRTPDFEEMVWKGLSATAKLLFRTATTGLVLERAPQGDQVRARAGATTVTLVGAPSELLLFASGRTSDADVQAIGPDRAVDDLLGGHRAP